MLSGKTIKRIDVEDVGEVIIRYPKMSDARGLMELMNSLVREKADIGKKTEVSLKEEIEWMGDKLKDIEKNKTVHLVIEVNGDIKGVMSTEKSESDSKSHTAELGIILDKEIRGKGIGKEALNVLEKETKEKLAVEIITLCVYETNERAYNLYKKLGYRKIGVIEDGAFHDDRYKDIILLQKDLR